MCYSLTQLPWMPHLHLHKTLRGWIMNEVTMPGKAEPSSIPMWTFDHVGLDATRQFWDRSQTIASALAAWNSEVAHFVSQRINRNGETISQMAQCQNWSEAFKTEAQWLRVAIDDYIKGTSRLMESNTKFMGNLLNASGGTVEQPSNPTT